MYFILEFVHGITSHEYYERYKIKKEGHYGFRRCRPGTGVLAAHDKRMRPVARESRGAMEASPEGVRVSRGDRGTCMMTRLTD
jgi:hypothetical protein